MDNKIKKLSLVIIILFSVGLILNSNILNVFADDMGVSNFQVGDIVSSNDILELWLGDEACVKNSTSDSYDISSSEPFCEFEYNTLHLVFRNENNDIEKTIDYDLKDMYDAYINCSQTPTIQLSSCDAIDWKIISMYGNCGVEYYIELRPAHLKFEINTNNNDNQGTLTFNNQSLNLNSVEEDSIVNFSVNPKVGYKLKSLEITENNGNNTPILYENNNSNYSFKMPDSDITIKTVYEKIKYSINVEIVDETKELNINVLDMTQIEYNDEVTFKVTPIKGYKINSIRIIDENNNEIDYTTTDNKNYEFAMPNSNITIIPSYEKVKNSVNIDDNKNTKEFSIEVNDTSAVVYEDTVIFKVSPEDGYEVERIEIKDQENNIIEYRKTDKENEYEFIMPDTDVIITPIYRKIESINVPNTLKNPNTGTGMFIVISIIILIVTSGLYFIMKIKKNYIMK